MSFLRRTRPEFRPIPEEEAYARCHGDRGGDLVRVVVVERPPPRRVDAELTGELLRRAFESRLDARESP